MLSFSKLTRIENLRIACRAPRNLRPLRVVDVSAGSVSADLKTSGRANSQGSITEQQKNKKEYTASSLQTVAAAH